LRLYGRVTEAADQLSWIINSPESNEQDQYFRLQAHSDLGKLLWETGDVVTARAHWQAIVDLGDVPFADSAKRHLIEFTESGVAPRYYSTIQVFANEPTVTSLHRDESSAWKHYKLLAGETKRGLLAGAAILRIHPDGHTIEGTSTERGKGSLDGQRFENEFCVASDRLCMSLQREVETR